MIRDMSRMMTKRAIFAVLLLFVSTVAVSAELDNKIKAIIKEAKLGNARFSVYAESARKKTTLTDIDKDELLNPASCLKLITSAAALKVLGPDYRFITKFYLDKKDGGDSLWVKGFGDPSFVIERLEAAVENLIKAGMPAAIGDIFIDDTYFSEGDFPGRQKGSTRSYNAMTNAVTLNHSSVTVEVLPSPKVGSPPIVKLDAAGFVIENKATTVSKKFRTRIQIKRVFGKNGDTIKVSGRISAPSSGVKKFFNVQDPARHFGEALKAMLTGRGIAVAGEIKFGIVPSSARPFFDEKSPPLSEVIQNMNKLSNNFMAEQITKVLGATRFGSPGSTVKGMEVLGDYMKKLGENNFYIENGSGLSYKNKISAYGLFLVMRDMFGDSRLKNIYIDSLSITGEDGTLKKWDSKVLNGNLKAKTGSLDGISSLAGFLSTGDDTIIFAIMLNGGRVNFWKGRQVSQKIAEALVRQ